MSIQPMVDLGGRFSYVREVIFDLVVIVVMWLVFPLPVALPLTLLFVGWAVAFMFRCPLRVLIDATTIECRMGPFGIHRVSRPLGAVSFLQTPSGRVLASLGVPWERALGDTVIAGRVFKRVSAKRTSAAVLTALRECGAQVESGDGAAWWAW